MASGLVAEDDGAVGQLLRKFLERAGHQVHLAANGEEAMKLYLRHPIDVVVTDMQMPRGDGRELITALKGMYPDASIIAISGQNAHNLHIAQLAGARTILTKPIDRRGLIDAVEEASRPSRPGQQAPLAR